MGKQIDDIPLAQRRALAARLLLKGEGISEVSRKAKLSLPTVRKYKNLVENGGANARKPTVSSMDARPDATVDRIYIKTFAEESRQPTAEPLQWQPHACSRKS
jgi:transposase